MTDVFTKQKRSELMSHVRNKETKPEKVVRTVLQRMRYRCEFNVRNLPGSPDIVLPRRKAAIFVHGCFWHGHASCTRAVLPASHVSFWRRKLADNAKRDARARAALRRLGWRYLVVWSCETRKPVVVEGKLRRFLRRNKRVAKT